MWAARRPAPLLPHPDLAHICRGSGQGDSPEYMRQSARIDSVPTPGGRIPVHKSATMRSRGRDCGTRTLLRRLALGSHTVRIQSDNRQAPRPDSPRLHRNSAHKWDNRRARDSVGSHLRKSPLGTSHYRPAAHPAFQRRWFHRPPTCSRCSRRPESSAGTQRDRSLGVGRKGARAPDRSDRLGCQRPSSRQRQELRRRWDSHKALDSVGTRPRRLTWGTGPVDRPAWCRSRQHL